MRYAKRLARYRAPAVPRLVRYAYLAVARILLRYLKDTTEMLSDTVK